MSAAPNDSEVEALGNSTDSEVAHVNASSLPSPSFPPSTSSSQSADRCHNPFDEVTSNDPVVVSDESIVPDQGVTGNPMIAHSLSTLVAETARAPEFIGDGVVDNEKLQEDNTSERSICNAPSVSSQSESGNPFDMPTSVDVGATNIAQLGRLDTAKIGIEYSNTSVVKQNPFSMALSLDEGKFKPFTTNKSSTIKHSAIVEDDSIGQNNRTAEFQQDRPSLCLNLTGEDVDQRSSTGVISVSEDLKDRRYDLDEIFRSSGDNVNDDKAINVIRNNPQASGNIYIKKNSNGSPFDGADFALPGSPSLSTSSDNSTRPRSFPLAKEPSDFSMESSKSHSREKVSDSLILGIEQLERQQAEREAQRYQTTPPVLIGVAPKSSTSLNSLGSAQLESYPHLQNKNFFDNLQELEKEKESVFGSFSIFKVPFRRQRNSIIDDMPEQTNKDNEDKLEEQPILHGYLHKLNQSGVWQRRFFESYGKSLSYYKSVKRTKVLATLDLIRVGDICMYSDDPDHCIFQLQVAGRPYFLKADNSSICQDWVITLNRIREARTQAGGLKLVAPSFQPQELFSTRKRSTSSNDMLVPRISLRANRDRSRKVSNEKDLYNVDENEIAQRPSLDPSTSSFEIFASWQKPRSKFYKFRVRLSRFFRKVKLGRCGGEDDVIQSYPTPEPTQNIPSEPLRSRTGYFEDGNTAEDSESSSRQTGYESSSSSIGATNSFERSSRNDRDLSSYPMNPLELTSTAVKVNEEENSCRFVT